MYVIYVYVYRCIDIYMHAYMYVIYVYVYRCIAIYMRICTR